ncbi:Cryptochrome-2 [Trichinella pseudospiralis]
MAIIYQQLNSSTQTLVLKLTNFSLQENKRSPTSNASFMDWTGWSAWKIGAIATAGAAALLLVGLITALILCRKRRGVQPKADSIYSVPDRWDSLSLHYIDNPTEFLKGSWEELSDDSYLACLEKEIAKRLNCVHAYQNPVVNSCELRLDPKQYTAQDQPFRLQSSSADKFLLYCASHQ